MDDPAFQVIVLGPTGGPKEDAVTGLLVRSTSTSWSKSSVVAVDAGTLLAGIVRILDQTLTTDEEGRAAVNDGPFVGLQPPHKSSHANAAYIFREVIASVLITHPHLDHLSGLAINTPIVEASNGPKTVAGLPSAISAMKHHMFNDIIWPNLSDEDGGAGLITYQRLVEGGNPRFGRGESRGYVRACEGLVTKCLSVSHGRCKQRYDAESGRHHRIGSAVFAPDQMVMSTARKLSIDQSDGAMYSPARSPHFAPGLGATPSKDTTNWGVVESSAFFIRDDKTGKEIIIFGDIEPDSVSLEPRNKRVWEIAAPKIVTGSLRAIFIECSYNDAIDDETLYGHLCPRHLIAELKVLASKVEEARPDQSQQEGQRRRGRSSKRKRKDSDTADYAREQPTDHNRDGQMLRNIPPLALTENQKMNSSATGASQGLACNGQTQKLDHRL
uniref:3',5'-cyclic-nucleotide phosphodiesterase n=1 Tax=Talaromyces marneffei PM1 TaxID=1077442 RepID=A0A093XTN7_TALMA